MKKKIRVQINKGGLIELHEVDVDTALPFVEIPSRLELDKKQGDHVVLHYPNSTERYKSVRKNRLKLVYGETSGRIKEVFKDKGQLYDTDLHDLPLIIAGNPKTLRFKRNVTDGLGLVKSVLEIEQ